MVASENTVAGELDADGVLALPENVRQFAHSLPSGITNLCMFGLLAINILSGMLKNVMTSLTLQQENEAFTIVIIITTIKLSLLSLLLQQENGAFTILIIIKIKLSLILLLQQENEAFTRQMAAKSRKIVMDAEHGQMLDYFFVFLMESKGKGYART